MKLLGSIVWIALEAGLTVLCAEVFAGFVHWFEDAYIREDTPLIGRWMGRPNIIHHHYPRYMTRNNWWQSNYDVVIFGMCVVTTAWLAGVLTWEVWLFAVLCANATRCTSGRTARVKRTGR
jgi:ubiquitin-conjugating enzyme E2 variant